MASTVKPADRKIPPLTSASWRFSRRRGTVPTPSPGVAGVARDRPFKRPPPGPGQAAVASGSGADKGRATEALTLHHPHIVRTRRWLGERAAAFMWCAMSCGGKNLRQTHGRIALTPPDGDQLRGYFLPGLRGAGGSRTGAASPTAEVSAENILIADDGMCAAQRLEAPPTARAPQHLADLQRRGDGRAAMSRRSGSYLISNVPADTRRVRFAGRAQARIEGVLAPLRNARRRCAMPSIRSIASRRRRSGRPIARGDRRRPDATSRRPAGSAPRAAACHLEARRCSVRFPTMPLNRRFLQTPRLPRPPRWEVGHRSFSRAAAARRR